MPAKTITKKTAGKKISNKKLLRTPRKRGYDKVSLEMVRHVASVARLDLTEAEVKKFQKDLNDILSAFRELDKAKPPAEASFQPIPVRDVTREDDIEKGLSQEEALENTKHKQDGYFRGPRVV